MAVNIDRLTSGPWEVNWLEGPAVTAAAGFLTTRLRCFLTVWKKYACFFLACHIMIYAIHWPLALRLIITLIIVVIISVVYTI